MQIINVIELLGGVVNTINSYPILSDENSDELGELQQVKSAQTLFLQLAKKNGFEEYEGFTEEDLLDQAGFDNMNGYEVLIVWSHEVYL